jgi:hypothetical protein
MLGSNPGQLRCDYGMGCQTLQPLGYRSHPQSSLFLTLLCTTYKEGLFPLAITVYSVWLVILFMALAVAADEYFCPATDVIAKTCR